MRSLAVLQKVLLACALLIAAVGVRAQNTVVGGDLFVAQPGPVGVTLLSDGGVNPYSLTLFYNNVYLTPTNNPQDKWGQATVFNTGAAAGSTVQVQLQRPTPDVIHGQPVPSAFPIGMPLQLQLSEPGLFPNQRPTNSTTASINKDIPGLAAPTARVSYGSNDTAIVNFPSGGGAFGFSVRMSNVFGSGGGFGGGGCS
jgi:hypothetical protein